MNRADKVLLWIKLVLSLVQLVAALALIGLLLEPQLADGIDRLEIVSPRQNQKEWWIMVDMETMSGRMRADMRHVFHETGRLWPVADAHGATVLFGSKDAADLYAAEHDAAVGAPMPTMKAATLWSAVRMTLAADGGLYEITALPDVERRTGAKRPGARVRGALTMEALAKTPEDALALADRTGRAAVKAVGKGLAPNLAIGRLVYRERRWMEEGL